MRIVGLMSGTSLDAIDAALIEVERRESALRLAVRAFVMQPITAALRERVRALLPPAAGSTAEVCAVNVLLGEAFAGAALAVVEQAGVPITAVDLIGSHGQTVYHQVAAGAVRSTLQLGAAAVIAERTGRTVVADFRPRDMAAGGQGAPLVPYLDALLFGDARSYRAVQNIGGMSNVTYLPPIARRPPPQASLTPPLARLPSPTGRGDGDPPAVAFDTGPGNVLIDEAMRILSGGAQTCDRDGRMAAAGRVDEALLAAWLAHPFFERPPPKSTGREEWGRAEAQRYLAQARAHGLAPEDTIATLTALTARSIAAAYRSYLGRVDEALICGGGARNPALLAMLRSALPGTLVRPIDELGLDAEAKEAVAFALLGYTTLHGWPNNLPAATGAAHPVVLGSITPGANYRALLAQVLAAPLAPLYEVYITENDT